MSMVNQFFTNEYTEVIQRLVRQIVNDPTTYKGSALLPSVALQVNKIRTEVVESTGGVTNQHLPGTDPQYIQSFGTFVEEFIPPKYKEKILMDENDILWLRELGQNGRNVRGAQQYIDLRIDHLNRRVEARIELERWNAVFNGGFTWMGKTFSYGIPSANNVTPITAVWSTDGINANNAADPLIDLRYWLTGGYSTFRKYKVSKVWLNPNTARWILDNSNVRSYLTSYGANPKIDGYDLNKMLSFLIPGLPFFEVYDGWYQTQSVDGTGKVTTSDAIYFVPDGRLMFEVSNLPGGDRIGEFVQTCHLASGTINDPGFGKFLVVEDNTAPGTKGGPSNPYVDLLGGVYGGVNLYRPFDVLTGTVV